MIQNILDIEMVRIFRKYIKYILMSSEMYQIACGSKLVEIIYVVQFSHIRLFQEGNSKSFESNNFSMNGFLKQSKDRDFMQEFIDTANKKDKN